jgi:hypothetical protein
MRGKSMLKWKRFAPPASEIEVAQFEKNIGMQLPKSYRAYLLSSNGGQPCSEVGFKVGNGSEYVMLGCLYGLCKDESGVDLDAVYEELKDDLSTGFLAIGEDPGGNLLLLSTQDEDSDAILFWDKIGFLAKRLSKRQFRIASDIEEFLTSLRVVTDT